MGQGRDFAHMAARIQDRANILTSETSDLHKEEADLEQLKCVLRDEQREFQCIRREALVAQQERDTSEMEHLQAVKELEEYEDLMVSIQCQTEEFQSKMKNDLQYWEETLANKCESHRTEMNLYTKYLEGKIMAVEEASTRRRQQISILRTKAENFAKETEAVTEQQTQVRFEAERAVDRQEKHNTEMQELVSQVHASVNKVSRKSVCRRVFKTSSN